MKNSKHLHDSVRQNAKSVTQSHKHDANLRKNSTLFFQVGLIVCLLAAIALLEMQFETSIPNYVQKDIEPDDNFEMQAPNFKIYEEPKAGVTPKTSVKKVVLTKPPKIVEDDHVIKKALKIDTPDSFSPDTPFDPDTLNPEKPIDDPYVDFIRVEHVPVYPGCEKEKGNAARKQCMSDKITKLVQRKFNGSDIASRYGLSGKQRISVEFLIDRTGMVTEVKTRAPLKKLEEEAERVVNKIPKMLPGIQRDKPVGVRYTLPIVFIAE